MRDDTYTPPEIWTWDEGNGGRFASINRPTAGARFERELPVGQHPLQLYSMGTPNGQKVTILLEELLAAGHAGAEYDAWLIDIMKQDQFSSGFVAANPNSKIPALVDRSGTHPVRVFESGAILLYLAEKIQYAIDRFAMEVKRQMDVLDQHLAQSAYLAGTEYTIADMAVWSWYGQLTQGGFYGESVRFLQLQEYTHVLRWRDRIAARPAVMRGKRVNRTSDSIIADEGVAERHAASDLD